MAHSVNKEYLYRENIDEYYEALAKEINKKGHLL